jgi:RNA polymerase sigma-70 factor (ECF subfamily)
MLSSSSDTERHHRFLRLFTAHEPALRAHVRRLVPSRADADDVMQEVSVVLWDKFDTFEEGGDFRDWAFGVARFEVLAWMRDRGRDRLVLDEEAVARIAEEASVDEPRLERQREALEQCMQKVPAAQRGLLMLAYQEGESIQEIARQSGRSTAGFYQWLHRMRRLLLDCIRRSLFNEEAAS